MHAVQVGLRNGLLCVPWLRVVLDEAHIIKKDTTQQAKVRVSLSFFLSFYT